MRALALVVLVGCGRCGFDPVGGAGDGGLLPDTAWVVDPPTMVSAPGADGDRSWLVWRDPEFALAYDQRLDPFECFVARFDQQGQIIGTQTQLTVAGACTQPALVETATGYTAVWTDARQPRTDVFGVRLDAAGAKLNAEGPLFVSTSTDELDPSPVADAVGMGLVFGSSGELRFATYDTQLASTGVNVSLGLLQTSSRRKLVWARDQYAIVWREDRGLGHQLFFNRVDATGARLGPDVLVTAGREYNAVGVVATAEGYVVSWSSIDTSALYVTLLDLSGTAIRDVTVAQLAFFGDIVATGTGYAIAWTDAGGRLHFGELDAAGALVAAPVLVDARVDSFTQYPSLAWDGSGFGVAWKHQDGVQGPATGVYFTRIRLP